MNQFVSAEHIKTMDLRPLTYGGLGFVANTTVEYCYRFVPWFRRGANLRANVISSIPFRIENEAGEDVEDIPEMASFMRWVRSFLHMVELTTTLHGASYHLLETNRYNLNVTPRFVPTLAVHPRFDGFTDTIESFSVMFADTPRPIPTKQMVWVWEPNPFGTREPGPALGQTALVASGMLGAFDQMATTYFRSGGVPVTAVKVPPTTPKKDREEIKGWLQNAVSAVGSIFKFITVNASTEFEQVGSTIRDMMAPELTADKRDDVAAAFEVPPSVIDGKSANYATADSEMLGFYLHTAIPRAYHIQECLNARLFERFGLHMEFEPDRLNMVQLAQLKEAQMLSELTGGKPILLVNEAREWLDLEPLDESQLQPPPQPMAPGQPGQTPAPADSSANASAATDDMEPNQPVDETMAKRWLKASLDNLRDGKSAAVGTPWDAELLFAKTGRDVRAIYTNHWPRRSSSDVDAIRVAAAALSEYAKAINKGN